MTNIYIIHTSAITVHTTATFLTIKTSIIMVIIASIDRLIAGVISSPVALALVMPTILMVSIV